MYEIVLYDARGHGRSDISQAKTTLLDLARDMAGLIEGLGLFETMPGGSLNGRGNSHRLRRAVSTAARLHRAGGSHAFEMMSRAGEELREMQKKWREGAALNKQKSLAELIQLTNVHPHGRMPNGNPGQNPSSR